MRISLIQVRGLGGEIGLIFEHGGFVIYRNNYMFSTAAKVLRLNCCNVGLSGVCYEMSLCGASFQCVYK